MHFKITNFRIINLFVLEILLMDWFNDHFYASIKPSKNWELSMPPPWLSAQPYILSRYPTFVRAEQRPEPRAYLNKRLTLNAQELF